MSPFESFPHPPSHEQGEATQELEKSPEVLAQEYYRQIPKGAREAVDLLKDVLDLRRGGDLPPHMIGEARAIIQEAGDAHGYEGVWNAVMSQDLDVSELAVIIYHNLRRDMRGAQTRHHESVVEAIQDPYERGGATFGMAEPTYAECIEDKVHMYRSQEALNTLLLGAMARETANEFGMFSRELNPAAKAVALDICAEELQYADRRLVQPMKADAASIPLPSESQDLVFTNFLTPFIHENGLPSGRKIMEVLRESARVLREGGRLVMLERSVSPLQENSIAWVNKLLLELSMQEVGLKTQPTSTVKVYTHPTEKTWGVEMGSTEERVYENPYNGEPVAFEFSAVGDK